MRFKCLVINCRMQPEDTFHRLPKRELRRRIWLDRLKLPSNENGRICSKHFDESDFDVKTDGRRYLNSDALPKVIVATCVNEETIDDVTEAMTDDQNVETLVDEFDFTCNEIEIDEWVDVTSGHLNCSTSIYKEHNYSKFPLTDRRSLVINMYRQQEMQRLRRANKRLRKTIKQKQIAHKKENLKFANFSKLSDFEQELILLLLKHHQSNSHPKSYSPIMRKFALSLHYYSPSGYEFVRGELNKCLPHSQTISEWYRVIDGEPGFTNDSLDAIAELQNRTPFKIVVAIVVDGMAIRKKIQLVGQTIVGYTDFGGVFPDENIRFQLAKEALIYMVVGVNVPFKLPLGYFLINSITGKQLSYLTDTGITLVSRCGVVVGSLTYDGLRANFTMGKELGCIIDDVTNLITSFEVGEQNVYVFPDMCHMLKLARNFLSDEQEFVDGENRKICWKYFFHLNRFQQSQGFHLGNKVRNLHVNYKNQIMKVYLATQLFSQSVADAIEFCDETLKLPDFKFSAGTVEFIRVMNDIFDIFNSRDMSDKGYKQPINRNNYSYVMSRLHYIWQYLLLLKHNDGTPVHSGRRQTFVVGMLMLIQSIKKYFDEFVETKRLLSFVPTYRQSQDSAEIFNCNMRSFGGYNTNPSAVVLKSAYKKSLLHVQFHKKFTGNCNPLENLPILHKSSTRPVNQPQYIGEDEVDESLQNSMMLSCFRVNWKAYYDVIAHISGYIARILTAMLKCNTCCKALIRENESSSEVDNITDVEFEDIGIEDVEMEDVEMEDVEMEDVEDVVFSCENGVNAANIGISCNREFFDIEADEDIGYTSDFLDVEHDEDAGYSSDFCDDDNDSVIGNDMEVDVGQVTEICEKYLDLIKKKDRGGLFYPSDSLYRIAILADITFKSALQNSGGKMVLKEYNLKKLVLNVHRLYRQYSDIIFHDLNEHFLSEDGRGDCHSLVENISKFYLKIRINYLNKIVSSNSGKRQKALHELHFQGM